MDLDLSTAENAAIETVAAAVDAAEGLEAARERSRRGEFDVALDGELIARLDPGLPLMARVLVVEEVARLGLAIAAGPRLLLATELDELDRGTVGLSAIRTAADVEAPVRFGPVADSLLLVGDEEVGFAHGSLRSAPLEASIAFPYSRIPHVASEPLAVAVDLIERRWILMLCAEVAGNLRGALERLVEHLGHRVQFGASLSRLQALRHRVSEALVDVESISWLTRYAAANPDSSEALLDAAVLADQFAGTLVAEVTQLAGARAFVLEFGLQVWTMRAFGLRAELIGRLGEGADSYRGSLREQAV